MTLEDECTLSYYNQIASLSDEHCVYLVQRTDTKKLFVKKVLSVYNAEIYRCLQSYPIKDTPRIYEVVEDNGRLTVIEEYITGQTLEERLEEGALPEGEAVKIAIQLCRIVKCLHDYQPPIIHRDIKPANIILSPDGIVKLLDMNAAKWSHGGSSRDTELIGTVGYAAPEQYGFSASTVQTDIYSIGVLINKMTAGVFPNEHITNGILGKIVRKCTRLEPSERYADVDELIKALEKLRPREPKDKSRLTRYAPPGFRSDNNLTKLFSLFGYLVLAFLSFSIQMENAGKFDLWLNRTVFFLAVLTEILFFGNYLGIQESLGFENIKNRFLRFMLLLAAGIILFIFFLVFLMSIESCII